MLEILKKICSTLLQKAVPKRCKIYHSIFYVVKILELRAPPKKNKEKKKKGGGVLKSLF